MSENHANLILHNVRLLTLDQDQANLEIVAIKGSRLLAIGSRDELDRYRGPPIYQEELQ
ncbi:MAG: hypothetical protein SVZ03_08145 [Spirochaetota bacterium]|nr:hypothetical protein [Spirochaetota bacterium]